MTFFKAALAAATILGGASLAVTPAAAQGQAAEAQRNYNLSRAERAALAPLIEANTAASNARAAGQTANWAAVQALLPAAQAAARGNDARYMVARVQLNVATGTNNLEGQEQALGVLLASPSASATERAAYQRAVAAILSTRAGRAFDAGDFATAERLTRQQLQADPSNAQLQNNLRIIQQRSGNTAGASQTLQQQIQAARAAGQAVPQDLLQRAFQIPAQANQRAQASQALAELLRAYPTPANIRLGVDYARSGAGRNEQLIVDVFRFARAANVVDGQEYLYFAQTLNDAGLPGETKAVLDAGVAANAVTAGQAAQLLSVANRRIAEDRAGLPGQITQARAASSGRQARIVADTLYGYGRYAEAADLYRLALSKGGEDAALVNTRLGASLALGGQRAAAEAALRAVTGPRAELAQLWLAWLARSGG